MGIGVDEGRDELRELIEAIPGENGWWHPEDGDHFCAAAVLLMAETDWTAEMAVDFLAGLYGVAANEFGG